MIVDFDKLIIVLNPVKYILFEVNRMGLGKIKKKVSSGGFFLFP